LWVPEKSERIIEFGETLTVAEGKEERPVKLMGFQHFDLGVPMGWVKRDGYRRFRRKYKSVARQNGKTFENGITGTYIAACSGYKFGKLFTAATKKRQARIAWERMASFIMIDNDLEELFAIKDYKSLIIAKNTLCTIEALSREGGLDEGFQSIFNSIDEIHQHKDNSVYKGLYDGTKALDETLNSMITTRGKSLTSFCYEMDNYCVNILEGGNTAEDFFVDIYALDKDDDPFKESNWAKANPYLYFTEQGREGLRGDAQTAKDMGGSELSDFLCKTLNIWVYARDNQYIDVSKWVKCGTSKRLSDMRGRECYVGLDFSSGGDLTTIALDFPETPAEKEYIYSHSFMPRGRFEEHIKTDVAPYDMWEEQELLTVTGGQSDYKNDFKFIISHLKTIIEGHEIVMKGIGYDPHNADGILSDLEEFGVPLLMITQSARFLNDATEDLQLKIKSLDIEYDKGNELMTWSFSNAKTVKNSFGEMKVDKEPRAKYKRIDPVDAVIDARVVMIKDRGEGVNLDEAMEKYLAMMGWKEKEDEVN
jgi:phage terminase large subunit-like protein